MKKDKSLKINTLIIDTELNDSKINYAKSDISSNYDLTKTFDQIVSIFNNKPADIFNYACDSIVLIDENDEEVPLFLYGQNICKFLKITVDGLTLLLQINQDLYKKGDIKAYQMKTATTFESDACFDHLDMKEITKRVKNDSDGYRNTMSLLLHYKNDNFPTINHCHNHNLTLLKYRYFGYVPAVAEMQAIMKYQSMINYILSAVSGKDIEIPDTAFWTSTELNYDWGYQYRKNLNPILALKRHISPVVPLFKQFPI